MNTPLRLRLPDADRLLVVMSDIEMGAGGPFDDFPHSQFLGELIVSYNEPPYADLAVDLVLNGDTFDLLKTSFEGSYPRHITRKVALGKMERVCAAHGPFFEALRQFCGHTRAERRVYFVAGNHDPEIFFPEIQQLIEARCGPAAPVFFPGLEVSFGKVKIEHGSQFDPMFHMDPDARFVHYNGDDVLLISWGSAALLDVVMQLQPLLYFHDRLRPKGKILELLPEIKDLLVSRFWKYWTRDFWQGYFKDSDPTMKLTWTAVKELVWRASSKDAEVSMDSALLRRMLETETYLLYVVGHLHQSALWTFGDRKLIQTGCIRDEFMVMGDGSELRHMPKVFAEVFMRGDLPVVSHMVELEGPLPPPESMPESIFDVVPKLRELYDAGSERHHERAAQQAQEEHEAREAERVERRLR